jgi:hypothetical protein
MLVSAARENVLFVCSIDKESDMMNHECPEKNSAGAELTVIRVTTLMRNLQKEMDFTNERWQKSKL